jgi:N-hydroxyarylamine O-acetyltransferase
MDLDAYLARIGYVGPRAPTIETLRAMHRAHAFSVPFETLDIHLGRHLDAEEGPAFEKVIGRHRGGWCHELNGLWVRALRQLGFEADLLAASVDNPNRPIPFGHETVLVHLAEPWLSDVGFGGRMAEPLRLVEGAVQQVGGREYILSRDGERWWLECQEPATSPMKYYFTLQPRDFAEFHEPAAWQQSAPESHFTHRPIASLATPTGRVSLLGNVLTEVSGGQRTDTLLNSEAALDEVLAQRFGLYLSEHTWHNFPWA